MEVKSREKGNGSHFVLVHGACHGAWCWYKLSDLLEKAGHVVTAIDLGGGGINPKDGDAIRSLAEYNEPLAKFMEDLPMGDGAETDEKVILVGHSIGGVNLTCMMEQFPHRIAVAVFVTAFMPVPGTTPLQLIDEVYERIQMWGDTEFKYGLGKQQKKPTSFRFGRNFAREYLYQNNPSEDIKLAGYLIRSMPTLDEDVISSSENYGRVPRVYIVAKHDKGMIEELQRKMIADNRQSESMNWRNRIIVLSSLALFGLPKFYKKFPMLSINDHTDINISVDINSISVISVIIAKLFGI